MHGLEIGLGFQLGTNEARGPELHIGTEIAVEFGIVLQGCGAVGLRHMQPAIALLHCLHVAVGDGLADIVDTALRQGPQFAGGIEADPLDDPVGVLPEARQHKAGIAAGRVPGNAFCFQHRDRPALARDFARGGKSGQPRADHADIDIDIL